MVKHDLFYLSQDLGVDMGMHQRWSLVLLLVRQIETWNLRSLESLSVLLILKHHVIGEKVPEVQADLEQLIVWDATHLGQIAQAQESLVSEHLNLSIRLDVTCQAFNEIDVVFKD